MRCSVIYFFKYDFGGADWYNGYTLFNTFGGAIQILSMMVLFPLLRKFLNTIKIFYVSFVMAIAGYIVLFILIFTSMSSVFILFIPAFFQQKSHTLLLNPEQIHVSQPLSAFRSVSRGFHSFPARFHL